MTETENYYVLEDGEKLSKKDYYIDKWGYICHKSTKVLSVGIGCK